MTDSKGSSRRAGALLPGLAPSLRLPRGGNPGESVLLMIWDCWVSLKGQTNPVFQLAAQVIRIKAQDFTDTVKRPEITSPGLFKDPPPSWPAMKAPVGNVRYRLGQDGDCQQNKNKGSTIGI